MKTIVKIQTGEKDFKTFEIEAKDLISAAHEALGEVGLRDQCCEFKTLSDGTFTARNLRYRLTAKRVKIKKVRKSKLADRLKKIGEVSVIDESYRMTFGQLKGLTIREAIIADFRYVDWCVQQKIFKLNSSLQKLFDRTVEARTFTNEEAEAEAKEWMKIFDRD